MVAEEANVLKITQYQRPGPSLMRLAWTTLPEGEQLPGDVTATRVLEDGQAMYFRTSQKEKGVTVGRVDLKGPPSSDGAILFFSHPDNIWIRNSMESIG